MPGSVGKWMIDIIWEDNGLSLASTVGLDLQCRWHSLQWGDIRQIYGPRSQVGPPIGRVLP